MKKAWKKLFAVLLAGIMVFSLAACGGNGDNQDDSGNKGNTPGNNTPNESDGDSVTLTITWWGGESRHEYTQQLLDLYTKEHPNIHFEAVPSGWDGYFDKMATQAATGSMPDIVQMDYLYISTFSNNTSIADLQPYIDSGIIDVSGVAGALLNSGNVGGKQTGIPLSASILTIGYNREVLEAAKQDVPADGWTWEDYIALNTAVAENTGKPSAMAASIGPVGDTNVFNYWVRQHGYSLFNEDGTGLGFEDDSITADFFKMWKDMMDAGVSPNPDQQSQIASLGNDAHPVVTGDAATTIDWNNVAIRTSKVNPTMGIALPPTLKANDYSGLWIKPGMFFSVAQTSQHKEEAAAFINWFINSEEANDIIAGERGTPVSSAIREYMIGSGKLDQQTIEMFEYADKASEVAGATPAPDPAGISEVNESFANAGNSVFYGIATPEAAAATFRQEATEILVRNNSAE